MSYLSLPSGAVARPLISGVTNAAGLRAVAPSASFGQGITTVVAGLGAFAFDTASLAVDNGTTVIKPNDILVGNPGRWLAVGGGGAEYAQFYTDAQQIAAASGTTYDVTWETKGFGSAGITCPGVVGSPNASITIGTEGVYNVRVRTQGAQTLGGVMVLRMWCELNGTDVAGTMSIWQIPYATIPNTQGVHVGWFVDVPASGVLKVKWAVDNTGLSLAQQNYAGVTSRAVAIELNKVS